VIQIRGDGHRSSPALRLISLSISQYTAGNTAQLLHLANATTTVYLQLMSLTTLHNWTSLDTFGSCPVSHSLWTRATT